MAPARGDELIDLLRAGGDGSSANELLKEIFRGYPVENLGRLLDDGGDPAAKAAAWVLSELGPRAAPMMDEVTTLLGHPLRYVRFFAVDAVLAGTDVTHGPAVAAAIGLIADPDAVIRGKVLNLLGWAGAGQLTSAIDHLPDARLRGLTTWLADLAGPAAVAAAADRSAEVVERLTAADPLVRAFAAAAAVRLARSDRAPLERAAASDDQDVSVFARRQLESGRLPALP